MFGRLFLLCASIYTVALAVPAATSERGEQVIKPLSSSERAELVPYAQFARAAYCPTSVLDNWTCGEACNTLRDFQPTLVGGDGDFIQHYFVGYWPQQNTIVVAHQGTNPRKIYAVLTDANIPRLPLDRSLFPGAPLLAWVHAGFQLAHARTARGILDEVKRLMIVHNTQSITCVGHSLGGALAELDALFLSLNLPSSAVIQTFTYGTPRVGNIIFANFVDDKVPNFRRINNQRDVVPILPSSVLGFVHPEGEIHIVSPGNDVACSGNENISDSQCTIRTVPILIRGNIDDHNGPYEGVSIGTSFCT